MSLETSKINKSGKYDEFKAVVFEEYIQKDMAPTYEENYTFNFLENIITVFRDRPKKVFALGNTLKTIPLFEEEIENNTPGIFKNPIKFRIFKKQQNNNSRFAKYLEGEVYDDNFKIDLLEFVKVYSNQNFMIYQHKLYLNRWYVTTNKGREKLDYSPARMTRAQMLARGGTKNIFYYKDFKVETVFRKEYRDILTEIIHYLAKMDFIAL